MKRYIANPNIHVFRKMPAEITELRRVAFAAIRDLPLEKWRHHGLGLLQAYIDSRTRIHVWHMGLERGIVVNNGARHDHRFDIESTVLAGMIVNHGLCVDRVENGPWTAWDVVNASVGEPKLGEMAERGLDIVATRTHHIPKGVTYTFPKWAFHWSEPAHDGNDVVVTVVTRHNLEDGVRARILSKEEPAHGFTEGHLPAPGVAKMVLDQARLSLGVSA